VHLVFGFGMEDAIALHPAEFLLPDIWLFLSFLWQPFFFCSTCEVIYILPRLRGFWYYFLCAISSTKSLH
jgi:hypothetical protein